MNDDDIEPLPAPMPARPADHPDNPSGRVGVLLIALGTPVSTKYWPMRRYLSEFLSDKRVIDYPAWFWQPLLQGVIMSTRPFRSGAAYRSIWNTEKDESPLRTITRDQAERLQARLGDQVVVEWGMRYGVPTIEEKLQALHDQGCRKVFLFALYPQYSATTMATAYDQSFRALMKQRWQPTIRTAPPYHDDPVYIDALARSMQRHLETLDFEPETVVASFHGLPIRYHTSGDPYHC
ncbi:MAG: ferrochelatase, partial [Pseudomonadota bacterium]